MVTTKNLTIVADFLRDLELLELNEDDRILLRTKAFDARAGIKGKGKKGIFISHSHQDKEFVDRLIVDLKQSGISIWIDKAELRLGDSLINKIGEGIDKMDYLAVVLSPDSVNSSWVRKEVAIAITQEIKGKKIKVLPILYRECEIPTFLEELMIC